MSDETPLPETPAPPPKRGLSWLSWSWLAWLGIIVMATVVVIGNMLDWRGAQEGERGNRIRLIVFDLQARYLVGAGQMLGPEAPKLFDEFKRRAQLGVPERLRLAVVAGELVGFERALEELAALKGDLATATEAEDRLAAILGRLYADYAAAAGHLPWVSEEEKQFLLGELKWYARLALHPPLRVPAPDAVAAGAGAGAAVVLEKIAAEDEGRQRVLEPAMRTLVAFLGIACSVAALGLAGLGGLIFFLVLAKQRRLAGGLDAGTGHGGIYAETFAVWMLLFGGGMALVTVLELPFNNLSQAGAVMLCSIVAVAWPALRGIPWRCVREDIGWVAGRNPVLEPAAGIACYVMSFPIVAIGLLLTWLLMNLQMGLAAVSAQQVPMHPVIEVIVHGDSMQRLQVFLLACIVAPLVEETMFRGVLYRHLREATGRFSLLKSFLLSGAVVSFLFAILHPPGIVAVPVLMALAFGFTLAREWRISLIPSMTAHALHNGMVLWLVIALFGGE